MELLNSKRRGNQSLPDLPRRCRKELEGEPPTVQQRYDYQIPRTFATLLQADGPVVYSHQPMTTNSFQGPFLAVPVWAVDVINKCGQPRDLQVLVGLVALMDRRNKEVTASVQQLSLHLGISKETTNSV